MIKRTKTTQVIAAARKEPETILPAELANMHFPKENGLSLLAWKMLIRVIDAAGSDICEDQEHKLAIATLNWSHRDMDFIEETVRELQRTIVEMQIDTTRGKAKKSGPILTDVTRDLDAQTGELIWAFSKTFRAVVRNSHHWAAVGARALLHMESKYAPPLYLIASLYAGRQHNTLEIPVFDLAKRIGANAKSMRRWPDFQRRALEPAIAEINHLTGIRIEWQPVKRGRKVEAVRITAWRKDKTEAQAAANELTQPRVGRKARRTGTVDTLADEQRQLREIAEKSLQKAAEKIMSASE